MTEFAEDLANVLEPGIKQRVMWCNAEQDRGNCETCEEFLQGKCEGHDPDAVVIRLKWDDETPPVAIGDR